MIDWNVIYWAFIVICLMPTAEMLIDIIRMLILLIRENYKFEAFVCRIKKDDYVDERLLDDALRLARIRVGIARKYT